MKDIINGGRTPRGSRGQSRLADHIAMLAFSAVLALSISGPLFEMTGYFSAQDKAWRPWLYVGLFIAQLVAAFAMSGKRATAVLRVPLLVVVGWCWLSLLWSEAPALAFRHLVLLTIVVAVLFLSVGRLGYRQSMLLARALFFTAMLGNFVVALAMPQVNIQTDGTLLMWRGFMAHKNIAGMITVVTILLFAFDPGKLLRFGRFPVIAACLYFLAQTNSRTAWVSCAIALIFGAVISVWHAPIGRFLEERRQGVRLLGYGTCAFVVIVLIGLTIERNTLLDWTSDSRALSLRNEFWRPLVQYYLAHPVLGSGYASYWVGDALSRDPNAFGSSGWLAHVDQAHNGYLDMVVQIGLPGLILALLTTFAWAFSKFGWLLREHGTRAAAIYAQIVFAMIDNLTESSLLRGDALCNVVLLMALAQIRRLELASDRSAAA